MPPPPRPSAAGSKILSSFRADLQTGFSGADDGEGKISQPAFETPLLTLIKRSEDFRLSK